MRSRLLSLLLIHPPLVAVEVVVRESGADVVLGFLYSAAAAEAKTIDMQIEQQVNQKLFLTESRQLYSNFIAIYLINNLALANFLF